MDLSLLFPRGSFTSTIMDYKVEETAMMIYKSTVWFRHARRHALRQYLTGSIHATVVMVSWTRRLTGSGMATAYRWARVYGRFKKHAIYSRYPCGASVPYVASQIAFREMAFSWCCWLISHRGWSQSQPSSSLTPRLPLLSIRQSQHLDSTSDGASTGCCTECFYHVRFPCWSVPPVEATDDIWARGKRPRKSI